MTFKNTLSFVQMHTDLHSSSIQLQHELFPLFPICIFSVFYMPHEFEAVKRILMP